MAGTWRGNCRPEHYNLDYSRFNEYDKEEKSDVAQMFAQNQANLPPEMREAFRLSQLAKETGDSEAARRAEELARAAILRGGPQIMERFKDAWGDMSQDEGLKAKFAKAGGAQVPTAEQMLGQAPKVDMKARLQQQRNEAEEALQRLEREQQSLQSISSPEQFVQFMASKGWTEADLEKALTDPEAAHKMMEQEFQGMVGRSGCSDLDGALGALDAVTEELDSLKRDQAAKEQDLTRAREELRAAEQQREALSRNADAAQATARAAAQKEAASASPAPRSPTSADTAPQPPEYTVVRGEAVLFVVRLPGVTSMKEVDLEVAPGQVRLTDLHSPARFGALHTEVPNVGAFEGAKFSKKLQGLTLTFAR